MNMQNETTYMAGIQCATARASLPSPTSPACTILTPPLSLARQTQLPSPTLTKEYEQTNFGQNAVTCHHQALVASETEQLAQPQQDVIALSGQYLFASEATNNCQQFYSDNKSQIHQSQHTVAAVGSYNDGQFGALSWMIPVKEDPYLQLSKEQVTLFAGSCVPLQLLPAQDYSYAINLADFAPLDLEQGCAGIQFSDYLQPPTPTSATPTRPVSPSLTQQKPPVYTKWTEDEDELLRQAIEMYGPHKWSLIAAHVPNRTPMQCSTRWLGALNPTIHKGRWTPEEDVLLKQAVAEFKDLVDTDGNPQPIPWNRIAARIPHRTGIQCQARWSEALDPRVRKGKWSGDEDDILKEGVKRYGRCWIRIAEMIEGRTQRQCRTRWVQIKNKQAKQEREARSATNSNRTGSCSVPMISPPSTTPTTPIEGATATTATGSTSSMAQFLPGSVKHKKTLAMTSPTTTSSSGNNGPNIHTTSAISINSPTMSMSIYSTAPHPNMVLPGSSGVADEGLHIFTPMFPRP